MPTSTSTSTGSSESFQFPVNPFLQSIASYAMGHAQDLANWGAQQYQSSSDLTDNVVNNFLSSSQMSRDLASNQLDRYKNKFQPQEDALLRDANSYASESRQRNEMGAAASGQEQAGEASRRNAIKDLEGLGIDPSSGRYAALDRAERGRTAAAAAGAAQQAQRATEQTGRNLRSQAIDVGQRLPGNALNAIGSGLNALSGAENSKLANINTGNAVNKTPNDYLATGMKLPLPQGNRGTNSSLSSSVSPAPAGGSDASSGGGRSAPGVPGGGGGLGGVSGGRTNPGDLASSMGNENYSGASRGGSSGRGGMAGAGGNFRPGGDGGGTNGSEDNFWQGPPDPWQEGLDNPNESTFGGFDDYGSQNYYGAGNDQEDYSLGDQGVDKYGADTWGDGSTTDDSGMGDALLDNGWDNSGSWGADDSGGGSGPSYDDSPNGASYDSWDDYAAGGAVPASLSPSGGAETDDVQANVNDGGKANINVGEFIIPRDIVEWKGQEFFQNLINKSRNMRVRAPAHASRG